MLSQARFWVPKVWTMQAGLGDVGAQAVDPQGEEDGDDQGPAQPGDGGAGEDHRDDQGRWHGEVGEFADAEGDRQLDLGAAAVSVGSAAVGSVSVGSAVLREGSAGFFSTASIVGDRFTSSG